MTAKKLWAALSVFLCVLCLLAYGTVSFAAPEETTESAMGSYNQLATRTVVFTTADSGGAPIAGAQVLIDGVVSGTTDAAGTVSVPLEVGTSYNYRIEKSGYAAASGSLDGVAASVSVLLDQFYHVVFSVSDGSMPLQGATISINGTEKTTDASGAADFYLANGSYAYTISKSGFSGSVNGSLTVSGSDVTEAAIMTGGNRVEFEVRNDADKPVSGAEIVVGTTTVTTNNSGLAYTWLETKDYTYTATDSEHRTTTGGITVNSGFTHVAIIMDRKTYSVIFQVEDKKGEPIPGAKIKVAGDVAITNAKGRARVTALSYGKYKVSVTKESYTDYKGTVEISSTNKEFTITMKKAKATPTPIPTAEPTPVPSGTQGGSTGGSGGSSGGGGSGGKGTGGSSHSSGSGGATSSDAGDAGAEASASATATQTPMPTSTQTATATSKPTPTPTPEPTYNLGFLVIDTNWNPIGDVLTELQSEPQTERTDDKGIVFFNDLEKGKHTFYVMNDDGTLRAKKEFEIVPAEELDLEPMQNGVDVLYISPKTTTVAVDAMLDGDKLSFVKLHEEDPATAVPTEVKQAAEKENKDFLVLLAICIACLIVAFAILFAATRLIGKNKTKDTNGKSGKWI